MNPRPGRLTLSLFALLFAQVALSQTSDAIQGIIYAAPGQDTSSTVVIACVVVNDECSDTLSKLTVINNSGSNVPYRLVGLGTGPFLMIAWRDLNDTSALDAGDEVGVYSRDGKTPTPVTPPASSIDLRLKAFGGDLDSLLATTEDSSQAQPTSHPASQPSGSIVGDWSTIELFADTVNANTGSYAGGNNSFTAAKFEANGHYTLIEYIYVTKRVGCTDWIFVATTGTYRGEPEQIVFVPKTSNQINHSGCRPAASYKRKNDPKDLGPFRYWWKLEPDRDGLEVLILLRPEQKDWFYADHLRRKKK
jgi:hypothetical protein